MTTTSEKYNATSPLVSADDEVQDSTGDTFHSVLLNNKVFTIRTDRRSAFLGDKTLGFGIHIFQNAMAALIDGFTIHHWSGIRIGEGEGDDRTVSGDGIRSHLAGGPAQAAERV